MKSAARPLAAAGLIVSALLAIGSPTAAGSSGSAATCGPRTVSQPFLPWHDARHYFLLPGGDLESTSGWTLAGGARLAEVNEPFYAHDAADRRSLYLPSGASARSATTCVDADEPTMRFFVRNTGSVLSLLAIEARVRTTLLGVTVETSLPLGVVLGTAQSWQPSAPVLFKLSANHLLGGTTTVDFRFTALGLGGKWHVDDVYLDPFKDR